MRPEPDKLFKNEAIYCNIILGQHIIPMPGIAMIKNEYDIIIVGGVQQELPLLSF